MRPLVLAATLMVSSVSSCTDASPFDPALPGLRHEEAMPPAALPTVTRSRTERVVLVVLDGVRWQDVYGPAPMPTLHRWMAHDGVALGGLGEMRATGPAYVSLPGYNEIFSGRAPECQSNECAARTEPTLLDELAGSGQEVAVVSSWESIERAASSDPDRFPCSTGRLRIHGGDAFDANLLRAGHDADAWPGVGEFRPDRHTGELAIDLLSKRAPTLLFVGLGEPDERAHRGDLEAYFASLRAADDVLAQIEAHVDDHTSIFVTTDHGRNAAFRDHGGGWPESGRVWLVAKGGGVPHRGLVPASGYRLADIAPTLRRMLGMRADGDPRAGRAISEIVD